MSTNFKRVCNSTALEKCVVFGRPFKMSGILVALAAQDVRSPWGRKYVSGHKLSAGNIVPRNSLNPQEVENINTDREHHPYNIKVSSNWRWQWWWQRLRQVTTMQHIEQCYKCPQTGDDKHSQFHLQNHSATVRLHFQLQENSLLHIHPKFFILCFLENETGNPELAHIH